MQPTWLTAFEKQLREQLQPLADRIRQRFPSVQVHISANSWGQATGADGYMIYLICMLPNVSADAPDNLDLEVSFQGVGVAPLAIADVCWGHPSGYIEAEWNHQNVPFTEAAQESFFRALPKLACALEVALERGKPPHGDA